MTEKGDKPEEQRSDETAEQKLIESDTGDADENRPNFESEEVSKGEDEAENAADAPMEKDGTDDPAIALEVNMSSLNTPMLWAFAETQGSELVSSIESILGEKAALWATLTDPAAWGFALLVVDLQKQVREYYELCEKHIDEASRREHEIIELDREAAEQATERLEGLAEKYRTIFDGLPELIKFAENTVARIGEVEQADLPEEVKQALQERTSAFKMVLKMLSRLPGREKPIGDDESADENPEGATQESSAQPIVLPELETPDGDLTPEQISQAIGEQVKSAVGDAVESAHQAQERSQQEAQAAYEKHARLRKAADKLERTTRSFLSDHLIYVVHANERGISQSEKTRQSIQEDYRENEIVDLCLNAPSDLDTKFVEYMGIFGMERIDTSVGDRFDENCTQAICTVESEELEDWQIAEITATGYILDGIVLRPTEVAVVRNPEQKDSSGSDGSEKEEKQEEQE